MERLTEKRDGKAVIPLRNAVCGVDMPRWCISKESDIQSFLSGDAADRLATYEDTDLEPEEITANYQMLANIAGAIKSIGIDRLVELAEADRDGRLVELPCKVKDTVYVDKRTIFDGWRTKGVSSKIAVGKVVAFSKNKQSAYMKIEFSYSQGTRTFRDRYVISAIGKTVFLTREAAEAALKAGDTP